MNIQIKIQKSKFKEQEMKGSQKINIQIILLFALVCSVDLISIDSNDLMNGEGLFLGSSISAYTIDSDHSASFIALNGQNILKLVKPAGHEVSYHEGLHYNFQKTKIKHVQFKFASSDPNTEDSNLRIIDEKGETLILFRAGRGGLIRVNEKQMISFYNDSVSTDLNLLLTQIDLKMHWQTKKIQVFVNNKFMDNCQFFDHSVEQVSQILIYNLYSSTSYWSNIVVCSQICYSFNFQMLGCQCIALSLLILLFFY